jgi:hypothetical protein
MSSLTERIAARLSVPVDPAIATFARALADAAGARAVARGARGLVSFGFAGGLDPALAAGALVVAEAVLEGVMRFEATPALAAAVGFAVRWRTRKGREEGAPGSPAAAGPAAEGQALAPDASLSRLPADGAPQSWASSRIR